VNILQTRGITKIFPGVVALNGVSISVEKGSVHGIVGENGAGKSTFINILAGILKPEYGSVVFGGEEIKLAGVHDATSKGISVVFQELSLIPTLSIAENIFANRQPLNRLGTIDWKQVWSMGRESLISFGLADYDPKTPVNRLSIASQQMIEILKAISTKPKLLILDEPTSSLTEYEIDILYKNIRKLKNEGCSFIYISHHLNEIFEMCDRVTILRDGNFVCDANVKDIDERFLINHMVGREISDIYGKRNTKADRSNETVLRVLNIGKLGQYYNISFNVNKGEIVTLAGLVGAGRTEVCRGLFGLEPVDRGKIFFCGREVKIKNSSVAITMGISYMTEDRKKDGLFLNASVSFNVLANKMKFFTKHGIVKDKNSENVVKELIKKYHIICTGINQVVSTLSGGNQQKVMIGTWVSVNPQLLIVDEPTRGIDVGAKSEVYKILRNLADRGMAILVVSSDLSEVLNISDRILVMRSGTIVGEINAIDATEQSVLFLATVPSEG
jgi:ABC-type sugar transport system ATPase subunit